MGDSAAASADAATAIAAAASAAAAEAMAPTPAVAAAVEAPIPAPTVAVVAAPPPAIPALAAEAGVGVENPASPPVPIPAVAAPPAVEDLLKESPDAPLALFWDLDSFQLTARPEILSKHANVVGAMAKHGRQSLSLVYTNNLVTIPQGEDARVVQCRTAGGLAVSAETMIGIDVMQFLMDNREVEQMTLCVVVSRDRIYKYAYLLQALRRNSGGKSSKRTALVTTETAGLTASNAADVVLGLEADLGIVIKKDPVTPSKAAKPPGTGVDSASAAHGLLSLQEDGPLLSDDEIEVLSRFPSDEFQIIWRLLEKNGWRREPYSGSLKSFMGPGMDGHQIVTPKMLMRYLQGQANWKDREDFVAAISEYRNAVRTKSLHGSPGKKIYRKGSASPSVVTPIDLEHFTSSEGYELSFASNAFCDTIWPELEKHGWKKTSEKSVSCWLRHTSMGPGEKNLHGVKQMMKHIEEKLGWGEEQWFKDCVTAFKERTANKKRQPRSPRKRPAMTMEPSLEDQKMPAVSPLLPNEEAAARKPPQRNTTKPVSYNDTYEDETSDSDLMPARTKAEDAAAAENPAENPRDNGSSSEDVSSPTKQRDDEIWGCLAMSGWSADARDMHKYFFPPGVTWDNGTNGKDYFDSIPLAFIYAATTDPWSSTPEIEMLKSKYPELANGLTNGPPAPKRIKLDNEDGNVGAGDVPMTDAAPAGESVAVPNGNAVVPPNGDADAAAMSGSLTVGDDEIPEPPMEG